MASEKPDLLCPVVTNPVLSRDSIGDPRQTVSFSDATPRTLIENMIQSHDTVQTTTRKRPRIQHSPVSAAKRVQRYSPVQKAPIMPGSPSPSKTRRRRSLRSAKPSLRKRASMNQLMKEVEGPTPRTMIQGFVQDAVEETPVVGSRLRKSVDDLEITPIELDKTSQHSFDLSKDSFLSDYPPVLSSDRLQMLRNRPQRQKALLNIEAFAAELRDKVGQSDEDSTARGSSKKKSRGRRTKDMSSDDEWRPPNTTKDTSVMMTTPLSTFAPPESPDLGLKDNELLVTAEIHPEPMHQSSSSQMSAADERSSSVGHETLLVAMNSHTEPQLHEEIVESSEADPNLVLGDTSYAMDAGESYGLSALGAPIDAELPQQLMDIPVSGEEQPQDLFMEHRVIGEIVEMNVDHTDNLGVSTPEEQEIVEGEQEIFGMDQQEVQDDGSALPEDKAVQDEGIQPDDSERNESEMQANADVEDIAASGATQEMPDQEMPSTSAEIETVATSRQAANSQERLASVSESTGNHGPNDETQLYLDRQDAAEDNDTEEEEEDEAEEEEGEEDEDEEEDLESCLFTPSQIPRLKQLKITDVLHSPNPLNFLDQMDSQDVNKSLFHMLQPDKSSTKKKQAVPRPSKSNDASKRKKVTDRTRAPRMPSALTKSIFQHFSRFKVTKEVMEEVEKVSDDFWKNTVSDLSAYASHANRKGVEQKDMDLLMRRQGFVTNKQSLNGLIENYLALEYREELIPIARSGNEVDPKS